MRDDLRARVAYALVRCHEAVGTLPTGTSYDRWRKGLSAEERRETPSVSSVVPLAFPTWALAREEAGLSGGSTAGPRGPKRQWSKEDCLEAVVAYLDSGMGYDKQGFVKWSKMQREQHIKVPSVAALNFRVSTRWEDILAQALRLKGEL